MDPQGKEKGFRKRGRLTLPDFPRENENPFRGSGAVAPEDRRPGHHEKISLVEKKSGEAVRLRLLDQRAPLVPYLLHEGSAVGGEDRLTVPSGERKTMAAR